jgi:hypothetical protein
MRPEAIQQFAIEAEKDLRMNPIETEDFWEDLLDIIEQGKV